MPNTVLETITVGGTTYDLPSGGSGMTSHIIVISDAGSTVTVTLPSGTVKTCTQVSGSTTQWETTSDEYGIHTIDAVKDGDDAQTTLNITMVGEYVVHDEHFTYTINVTAMSGSTIVVSGGSETYTGTGTGSALAFVVHGKNTTYTISVTVDGVSKTDSVTTSSTSGQSSSVTIQFGTINVTYENDFRGVSITCTLGGTTITKTAPSAGNTMTFYPPLTGQWTISGTVGGVPYSTTANVTSLSTPVSVNLETIPNGSTATPTDDIQKWLACAGIKDKAYTTLTQVLGDSETYNALLGDSNACAYMKRSTTWSTDICASQYAMNLLGQYDTACDALLSDSTWASAIVNSTYFESVLNVKVPAMTSDTTPSGEVISNGQYDTNEASWKAFDKNTGTCWSSSSIDYDGTSYIGYKFASPNKMHLAQFTQRNLSYTQVDVTIKYQGSNTGNSNDWHDISDTYTIKPWVNGTQQVYSHALYGTTDYQYYRCVYLSVAGSTPVYPTCTELQFYGRASSGAKIHGATDESAYILESGSPVTITDPSTLSAGTYTFYSTVAKDPADLTADYSKTIRICPNTKEIVVRPDNALYWWGYNSGEIEIASTANGWTFSGTAVPATFQTNYINVKANSGNTQAGAGTRNTITGKTTASLVYTGGTGGYARYLMGASKACEVYPTGIVYNDLATVGTTLTKIDLNIENKTGYIYVNCHNNTEVNIWALLAE